MSSETEHPIRKAEVHTWGRTNDTGVGCGYIARFYPYAKWPIFFQGESEVCVISEAEKFRAETLDKYEETYLNRMIGVEKARVTREKKKLEGVESE